MTLLHSSYYIPLRFHLVLCLQQLAASAEIFIPVNHILCEIIENVELFQSKSKQDAHASNKSSLVQEINPNNNKFQYLIAFPPNSLHLPNVRDVIMQELVQLFRNEMEIYRYSVSFPEYFYLPTRKLKQFLKALKVTKWKDLLRLLLSQIQSVSQSVKQERLDHKTYPQAQHLFEGIKTAHTPRAKERFLKLAYSKIQQSVGLKLGEKPATKISAQSRQSVDQLSETVEEDEGMDEDDGPTSSSKASKKRRADRPNEAQQGGDGVSKKKKKVKIAAQPQMEDSEGSDEVVAISLGNARGFF